MRSTRPSLLGLGTGVVFGADVFFFFLACVSLARMIFSQEYRVSFCQCFVVLCFRLERGLVDSAVGLKD